MVQENTGTGTPVGDLTVADPEGGAVTVVMTGDAGGRFRLVGDAQTGYRVEVANGDLLDYEAGQTHTITLKASDGGLETETTYTVSVGDVVETGDNMPPSAIVLEGSRAALEYAAEGTVVGTLAVTDDAVGGAAVTYSLTDDRFTVAGNRIVVKNGFLLDFEQAAAHEITVTATDAGGLSTSQVFTLGVIDVARESTAGSAGDDVFKAGSLNDVLGGGAGNDVLWGGEGKDVLTGGAGQDAFVFSTKPHKRKNLDKIKDFKVKDDAIWLDNGIFKKLGKKGSEDKPAKLKKAFFTVGSEAKDKNDYFVYDRKKGVLSYDADGNGGRDAVAIATLKKNLKLTHKDFFVI
jgi:Ca2+-binding RTX toxin-like protein